MKRKLCAPSNLVTAATVPSKATLYRVRQALNRQDERYYNTYWAQLDVFLREFHAWNPASVVQIRKTPQNEFKRYLVGLHQCRVALQQCGLDFFAIDSCFTKHYIVNGMQLHILVGRTGHNTVLILAWSPDMSETSESYQWFAEQCSRLGFESLVKTHDGPLDRNSVLFSDGFKGTTHFVEKFPELHHALCAQHLANSIRATLKRWKTDPTKGDVSVGFANAQVVAVCAAATSRDYSRALLRLEKTSRHAAMRLQGYAKTAFLRSRWATRRCLLRALYEQLG